MQPVAYPTRPTARQRQREYAAQLDAATRNAAPAAQAAAWRDTVISVMRLRTSDPAAYRAALRGVDAAGELEAFAYDLMHYVASERGTAEPVEAYLELLREEAGL